MLTKKQIDEHLVTLRIACDPKSPFKGMIDFSDGLMSLPIPEQQQVFDAMDTELKTMVMGAEDE